MTHKFCNELDRLLQSPDFQTDILYHYTTLKPHKRANAAYLMGAFQIIVLGKTAEDAWQGFSNLGSFESFRDASFSDNSFRLPILYCLKAIENAIKYRWYRYDTFNIDDYNHYAKFENGDISWILPNKLLAFSSPTSGFYTKPNCSNTTEKYCSIFRQIGVSAVIRLNKSTYEAEVSDI
jgi:cell division cycle 14